MLSYRHAFHAGNHADILKHYTLSLVLDYYNKKDKPYCVVDTHAGAGLYALADEFSQKNKEYETGITRLASSTTLPDSLARFVALVKSFNTSEAIQLYPGSPKVSAYHLRPSDQLRLFELHPNDYKILTENFKNNRKQTNIQMLDGFKGIKALLPPSSRRGIIVIDPPYEDKEDYQQVAETIQDSLKRFATGTYLIWYPLLPRPEPEQMINDLSQTSTSWLDVRLKVSSPSTEGYGMYGSGLFVINPPWTLHDSLAASLPYLTDVLAQDELATYELNQQMT